MDQIATNASCGISESINLPFFPLEEWNVNVTIPITGAST